MSLKNSFINRYAAQVFLFITALFIRAPFFFRDYIDHDESTFILMGQSIANGYLPYDHVWDLKPPLLFYFFSLIEYLFPYSFTAIRFSGVLIVFASALFLLKIAKEVNLKNGFLIALSYVIVSSEFGSVQGVMSEHLAVFFLLPGLLFFLKKEKASHLFIAGIFFGCAMLCKLSYAYAAGALLIFYFIQTGRIENFQRALSSSLFLVIGIFIPIVLLAIPFMLENKLELFINSVFLAPLEYARALQYSMTEKLKRTWWIIALGVFISFLSLKTSGEENRNIAFVLIALLSGTIYTFFSSGIVNGHYMIQVYPFLLLLLLGIIVRKEFHIKLGVTAIFVLLISFESISEYYTLITNYRKNSTLHYRQSFTIKNVLKKAGLDNKKIFFADYHIGYWLLKQHPLTKSTTHPSNLSRPFLFKYFNNNHKTSIEELKYLMEEIRPDIVVSKLEQLGFFSAGSQENIYFKTIIAKEFEILYQDSTRKIFIWQRHK
jgi:hypothetical protein